MPLRRGVDTRLLLNDNPTHSCEMVQFRDELNAQGGAAAIVGFPTQTGSHHQKMLAIKVRRTPASGLPPPPRGPGVLAAGRVTACNRPIC